MTQYNSDAAAALFRLARARKADIEGEAKTLLQAFIDLGFQEINGTKMNEEHVVAVQLNGKRIIVGMGDVEGTRIDFTAHIILDNVRRVTFDYTGAGLAPVGNSEMEPKDALVALTELVLDVAYPDRHALNIPPFLLGRGA